MASQKGYNYSILVGVDLDTKDTNRQLTDWAKDRKVKIDVQTEGTQSVHELADATDKATQSAEDLSLSYQVANQIFHKSIEVISSMVEQVYALDDAQVEFRKVSDLSGKALDDYVDKLSEMRTGVARSTTQLLQSASEFRKSGFSDEDSAQLAQLSAVLQNVADEEISAGDAANFLVSQLAAFGGGAEEATHVVDSINAVSNAFAVSSGDLIKSLPLVSAALSVGNNEFEEMIGLMTGATEINRNASKSARGLVSVQSRLNQIVDETSSTGQKLLAFYDEHNIQIFDQQGQLMSLYDILSQVAKQWDTLSTNEKDYYLNIQAGANQSTQLSSILTNFDHVLEATAKAYDSAGSAAKENEAAVNSLAGKTTQLQAAFQDLANDVISNELIGAVLDLTTKLLELSDTGLGQVLTKIALLTGLGWGTTSLLSASKILPAVIGQFSNFGTVLAYTTGGAGTLGEVLAMVGGEAGLLGGAFASALPVILAVSAAIVGVKLAYDKWREAHPTIEETTEKLDSMEQKLKANEERLKEINKIPWYERTDDIYAEAKALEAENEQLKKSIKKWTEYKDKKDSTGKLQTFTFRGIDGNEQVVYARNAKEAYQVLAAELGVVAKSASEAQMAIDNLGYSLNENVERDRELTSEARVLAHALLDQKTLTKEQQEEYANLAPKIQEIAKGYEEAKAQGKGLTEEQQDLIDAANILSSAYVSATEEIQQYSGALDINEQEAQNLIKSNSILKKYLVDTGEGWKLLKGAAADAANSLIVDDGRIMESSKERAKQVLSDLKTELEARLELSKALVETYTKTTVSEAERPAFLEKVRAFYTEKNAYESAIAKLEAAIYRSEAVGYVGAGTGDEQTGYTPPTKEPTETKTDKALQDFQSFYKDLQHERDLDKIDEAEYYNSLEVLMQNYIKDATANMDAYGVDKKKIEQNMYQYEKEIYDGRIRLEKETNDERLKLVQDYVNKVKQGAEEIRKAYQESLQDQIDALSSQQKAYQALFTMGSDVADDRIKSLQDELDALEEQNDAIEENMRLQEMQDRLAQAKSRKIRVYKDGRFQYISDVDEVASAQADIVDYQHQQLLDAEKKRINDQIEYWQDWGNQWSSAVSDYEKKQNELLVLEQFGITREDAMWDARILNLQDFVQQYGNLVEQTGHYQAMLNQFSGIPEVGTEDVDLSVDYLGQALRKAAMGDLQGALADLEYRNVKVGMIGTDYGTGYEEALEQVMEAYRQSDRTYKTYGEDTINTLESGNKSVNKLNNDLNNGNRALASETKNVGGEVNTGSKNIVDAINNAATKMETVAEKQVIATNNIVQRDKDTQTLLSGGSLSYVGAGGVIGTISLGEPKEPSRYASAADDPSNLRDASGNLVTSATTSLGASRGSYASLVSTSGRSSLTSYKKATGTTSAHSGLTLLGEQGPELGVLSQGDGVIPANLTENLWKWGRVSPAGLVSNLSAMFSGQRNAENSGGQVVTIQNLNLPSVKNGQEFVDYMRNNFWRSAVQFST